jgi:hypothetical protein
MWSPDGATRTFDTASAGLPSDLPYLLRAGDRFGAYLIVRPLGRGGMGQVYEAEELESGRRVALKILSRGIGDDEERERFLSEGRAAAALSHPNTVYVFGTSEAQGFPVISMALAPGGTLKDRVADGTPMAPAAAVDAILQVIAGLDAAASAGILHRDVKPSNCFIDREGRMLVGDFGLSIATTGRAPAANAATIAGTPGFSSPEQLRGAPLDVRSDIYSVGATLYYLLTGRPPFEDTDVTSLVTRMSAELPSPPIAVRHDLPKELSGIVMRCLARTPEERFPDYGALTTALEPFRSTTVVAAGLWRRFGAGVIDNYAAALLLAPLSMYLGTWWVTTRDTAALAAQIVPSLITVFLYYGWLEGRWGAAAGKALLGIRVATTSGARPGYGKAIARAAIFVLPAQVVSVTVQFGLLRSEGGRYTLTSAPGGLRISVEQDPSFWTVVSIAALLTGFLLMFCTARRRNGFAGLHDLASGTRVVLSVAALEARQAKERALARTVASPLQGPQIGPYIATEREAAPLPCTVEGYDPLLHRRVWIRLMPAGAAPLSPLRRDLDRPARTRWLAGRRTDTESWDAFEAIDGRPLTEVAAVPQPWSRVRHWLGDLAAEVAAGLDDGSLPVLDVSRVWIGADDHARLLDWTSSSADAPGEGKPDLAAACRFLYAVATRSLTGGRQPGPVSPAVPLPLHARALLESLRDARIGSPGALRERMDAVLRSPASMRRSRRAFGIALCAAMPVVLPPVTVAGIAALGRIISSEPDLFALHYCLERLDGGANDEERVAFETFIATRLRSTVETSTTWTRPYPALGITPGFRQRAERAVAEYGRATPEQRQRAEAFVEPALERRRRALGGIQEPGQSAYVALRTAALGSYVAAVLGMLGALLARGGLTLRIFGAALVRRDGADVSRLRAVCRASIVWMPVALVYLMPRGSAWTLLPLGLLAAGALWAIWNPSRGIQDRIAGTWIVPR